MDSRKITTEYRMNQWAQIIQDRKTSGQSVKDYCESRGLSRDSYFNWQRKLREATCEQLTIIQSKTSEIGSTPPGFTEIKLMSSQLPISHTEVSNQGRIAASVSGIKITADGSYPADKLAFLLRELVKAC